MGWHSHFFIPAQKVFWQCMPCGKLKPSDIVINFRYWFLNQVCGVIYPLLRSGLKALLARYAKRQASVIREHCKCQLLCFKSGLWVVLPPLCTRLKELLARYATRQGRVIRQHHSYQVLWSLYGEEVRPCIVYTETLLDNRCVWVEKERALCIRPGDEVAEHSRRKPILIYSHSCPIWLQISFGWPWRQIIKIYIFQILRFNFFYFSPCSKISIMVKNITVRKKM